MSTYCTDDTITLHQGDSLDVLRTLSDASVDCCVTSPPYFGLRDYGEPGQYGLEASPAEYVETMRALFAEVRRVLADDGTLWLNLGDSYYSGKSPGANSVDEKQPARRGWVRPQDRYGVPWSSPKNLLGIPWRTAFALQDDGWILRNDIIWSKPNAMPESVTDRLSTRHEHLFMFSKNPRYWFDLDPIREPLVDRGEVTGVSRRDSFARETKSALPPGQSMVQHRADRPHVVTGTAAGRNPGDVWTIPTQPFSEAHFAVMPVALAERAVLAGCKPGGPFLAFYHEPVRYARGAWNGPGIADSYIRPGPDLSTSPDHNIEEH